MVWLGKLAAHAVARRTIGSTFTKAAFISMALKELSVTMAKGNAWVYETWRAVKASPGKHLRQGDHIPSPNPQ